MPRKFLIDQQIYVDDQGRVATTTSLGANAGVNIGDVSVLSLPELPASTNRIGRFEYNTPTTGQLTRAIISVSGLGDNTLISGVGGQTIRVFKMFLVTTLAASLTFKSGTTALSGAVPLNTGASIVLEFDGEPWFITASGEAFVLGLSVGTLNAGVIYYKQS